jgi:acylphosphatase
MDEADGRDLRPGWTSAVWLVTGRVQGVGFRYHVLRCARRCEVLGDVRNLPDGRVEVRAQGPADRMERLLADVRTGPPGSRVDSIESRDLGRGIEFETFMIR